MPPLWPPEGIVQVDGDNRVAADIRSRVVGARPPKKCLAVLFSGRISADASITGSGHQRSHEFRAPRRDVAIRRHEDRDLSGGGVGVVSGVSRHGSDATVIDRDHRLVSPYFDVEELVERCRSAW